MGDVITLSNGAHRVEIDPDYGGRVTAFWSETDAGRVDWFTPTPQTGRDALDAHKTGMFPMTPFSNRIRDAVFPFGGRAWHLEATEAGRPHAIHGHGYRVPWTVTHQGESSAAIAYQHVEGEWPSSYLASQRFDLRDRDLAVHLIVENLGEGPMPVGLGLHPFFPMRGGVRLSTGFGSVWPGGEDSIPDGPAPLPEELDFRGGRDLPVGLDTGFGTWAGAARLDWPGEGVGLEIKALGPLDHAIVYSPEGQDFFCFEPVTHPVNAANQDGGLSVIRSGERFGVSVTFRLVFD